LVPSTRILKVIKDGKSNNRELTNARAELDHWRARLLQTIHKGERWQKENAPKVRASGRK
jgi:hypothetical protein